MYFIYTINELSEYIHIILNMKQETVAIDDDCIWTYAAFAVILLTYKTTYMKIYMLLVDDIEVWRGFDGGGGQRG